jgi:murein tripeptide amidase MpaA
MLTITDFKHTNNINDRQVLVVTGRIHPGESNGSWLMHGFLSYITSNSETANYLRNTCIFKVIPMLNPDGVILGNFRCSFTGKDLNRVFKSQ